MDRIFVQIVGYRDDTCAQVLHDIFTKAAYPDRIFVGLCMQSDLEVILPVGIRHDQVQSVACDWQSHRGMAWARRRAQTFWAGEEYVFAIDSRTCLGGFWDTVLIELLAACKSPQPVLSGPALLVDEQFDEAATVSGACTRGACVSMEYLFAHATIVNEVPFDPYLSGGFEKSVFSARLYTWGYDVYQPVGSIIARRRSDNIVALDEQRMRCSGERMSAILYKRTPSDLRAGMEMERYGLGTKRTLDVQQAAPLITCVSPSNLDTIITFVDDVLKKEKPTFDYDGIRHFSRTNIVDDAPPGMLVMENYIDADMRRRLVDYADQQQSIPIPMGIYTKHGAVDQQKLDPGRVTRYVEIGGMASDILNLFNDIYCYRVAPYYHVSFTNYERPQLLRYEVGGKFQLHADSDVWDAAAESWIRLMPRDYSVIAYLNDEYEGGLLHFPRQKYTLRPKAGMLVAFPSGHLYAHEVQETHAGIRYCLVSWGIVDGSLPARKPLPGYTIPLLQRRLT